MSRLRRATLRRRRRRRDTGTTEDILRLAQNSQMYSPLLGNYTLPVNVTGSQHVEGTSNLHDHYEAAIVYGNTELVITNLRHFQEYSIEVGR